MYGVERLQYGSVPRAVASGSQPEGRSLPLAVLIQSTFPYTLLQSALKLGVIDYGDLLYLSADES
jgi:hypothetical protein